MPKRQATCCVASPVVDVQMRNRTLRWIGKIARRLSKPLIVSMLARLRTTRRNGAEV